MSAGSLTLCIVNFNGRHYLPEALAAAEPHEQFGEILVVDDASADDSVAWLRAHYPAVRIVALPVNRGPGAARNAGLDAARGDLVLFQDNDVRLTAGCVERLRAAARDSGALLVAPRVLYADTPAIIQYDSADCHVTGLMIPRHANQPAAQVDGARARTTSLVTACFLLDRTRLPASLRFDEHFGFNYEDHDFGVRACIGGHVLLVEPAACVLHGGGTAGLSYRPGGAVSARRVHDLIRNRWYVIAKCFSARTLLVLTPVLLLYEINQLAGVIAKGWWRQWLVALRDCRRDAARLREERRRIQAGRAIGDRQLLRGGPLPLTRAVRSGALARGAVWLLERLIDVYWRVARHAL